VASINIFDAVKRASRTDVARALRSAETAMYVYDLAPGSVQCPYHYEYHEEWLLVVEGAVVVRESEGERTLSRGARLLPARTGRCAQGDQPQRRSGADADVVERACTRGLCLPGQQQGRRLAGKRGRRPDLPARHGCGVVVRRTGLREVS
jgi:hypothetical protein